MCVPVCVPVCVPMCVPVCVPVCVPMCVPIWLTSKQKPIERQQETIVSKETYYSVKRDLLQCQKRPTTVSKETYYSEMFLSGLLASKNHVELNHVDSNFIRNRERGLVRCSS
jgi:hypothetical protein